MQDDDPFEEAASLQLPSNASAPAVAPEDESDGDDELVSVIKQSRESVGADDRQDDQGDATELRFAGTSSPVTLSLALVVFGILGMATLMLSGAAEASSLADSTFPASGSSSSHSRPCPSPRYEFVRNGLYDCALYELHDMSRCASFAMMASDVHEHRDTLAAACAEKCDSALDCAGFSAVAVEGVERGCWLYSRLEDVEVKNDGPRHQDVDRGVGVVSHVHSAVCAKTSTADMESR